MIRSSVKKDVYNVRAKKLIDSFEKGTSDDASSSTAKSPEVVDEETARPGTTKKLLRAFEDKKSDNDPVAPIRRKSKVPSPVKVNNNPPGAPQPTSPTEKQEAAATEEKVKIMPPTPKEEMKPEPPKEEKKPQPPKEEKKTEAPKEEKKPEPPKEEKSPEPPKEEKKPDPRKEEKKPEPQKEEKKAEYKKEEQKTERPKEEKKPDPPKEEKRPEPPKEEKQTELPKEEKKPEPPKDEKKPEPPKEEKKPESPKEEKKPEPPKEEKKPGPPKEEKKPEPPKEEPKSEPTKKEPITDITPEELKSEPPKEEPKQAPPKEELKPEPPKDEQKPKPPKEEAKPEIKTTSQEDTRGNQNIPPPGANQKKVLLVYVGPSKDSADADLRDATITEFEAQGCEVTVSDLVASKFQAVLSPNDFGVDPSRDTFDYITDISTAVERGTIAADIKAEQNKVQRADLIIIQYQTVLHTTPALVMGWLQRVFLPSFAFDVRNGSIFDKGLLLGKRVMLSIAALGVRSAWTDRGILGDINVYLWPIQNGILRFCGLTVLPAHVSYNLFNIDNKGRDDLVRSLRSHLKNIWVEKPMHFIKSKDFNDDGWVLNDHAVSRLLYSPGAPTVGQHLGRPLPTTPLE